MIGASAGLGLCSCHHLVNMNVSTLILAVRNVAKGEKARDEILSRAAKTNKKQPHIEVWQLDLCSYASIIAFVDRCKTLSRIDAVLENAGISVTEFSTAEGEESTIMTNVLGVFLSAILLLPLLRKTAETFNVTPRIAIVGSAVHFFAPTKELLVPGNVFDGLSNPKKADMKSRYFVSKLVVTLMIRELAQRITESNQSTGKPMVILTDNAPGLNRTFLTLNEAGGNPAVGMLLRLIGRKPEIGSRTSVNGLVAGMEAHGQYLSECVVKP